MADDYDVEDMLEEVYNKKPSSEENGSGGDSRKDDKKRHKRHKSRSKSPHRRHSHRRRSGSKERRRSRSGDRRRRKSRSRSPRRRSRSPRRQSRDMRRNKRSPTPERRPPFAGPPPPGPGPGPVAPPMYKRVGGRSPEPEIPTEDRDRRTVMCMQLAAKIGPRHLEEFFQKVGQVREVKMIADKNSRRSKGIAYVEFHDESSVMEAMRLTGQKLYGVPIIVQPTMAEKNRLAAQAQNLMKQEGPRKLYVGNLSPSITDGMLKKIFEPFGNIEKLTVQRDDGGKSKGFGFIEFKDSGSAERAVQNLNDFEILDRKIKVTLVTDNPTGGGGAMELLDGDEFQGGVGLTLQSRASLMAKLAETHNVGLAPPTVTMPVMSTCFMLSNMFDPQSETEADWEVDIRDDVLGECSAHGPVLHIHVDMYSQGNVYVKCATPQIAASAFHALNGRLFSGKKIVAQFIPDDTYHSKFPVALRASQPLQPLSDPTMD